MVKRAAILCSNRILFIHTLIALKIRFQISGYPNTLLMKYMDINIYNDRNKLLQSLKNKRLQKITSIINQSKIKYKPKWIPNNERKYVPILYDKTLASNTSYHKIKKHVHHKHPHIRIIPKLNNSIQKIIRCKDAKYDEY